MAEFVVEVLAGDEYSIVPGTDGRLDIQLIGGGPAGARGPSGDGGPFFALGNKSGALDFSAYTLNSQIFSMTATGNLTIATAGMPQVPDGMGGSFSIRIQQGTPVRTLTIDAAIKSSFGNKPALTAAIGAIDLLTFMWTGVEWIVLLSGSALS